MDIEFPRQYFARNLATWYVYFQGHEVIVRERIGPGNLIPGRKVRHAYVHWNDPSAETVIVNYDPLHGSLLEMLTNSYEQQGFTITPKACLGPT